MQVFNSKKTVIHYSDYGPKDGKVIIFANSLGTDNRLWDKIIKRLPLGHRVITYDKRGHGLSKEPESEISIQDLASDIADLSDYLNLRGVTFVGISIGGMIAQVLASIRPDIISKLILCDTAVKIGVKKIWKQRIDAVTKKGIRAISNSIIERWFTQNYISTNFDEMELFICMLQSTSASGYIECCKAISKANLTSYTSQLKQPTLVIVGKNDISTPPSLVKETALMIHGSKFIVIENSGHLPCIDNPDKFTDLLYNFIR